MNGEIAAAAGAAGAASADAGVERQMDEKNDPIDATQLLFAVGATVVVVVVCCLICFGGPFGVCGSKSSVAGKCGVGCEPAAVPVFSTK